MYVHEVDEEREMWLNSFYKAPLRLPMPSELEYWWEKGNKQQASSYNISVYFLTIYSFVAKFFDRSFAVFIRRKTGICTA